MEKPRTTWDGGANRKIKDGPIWAVCPKCGEEKLTFDTEEGIEHYVCPSCRKKAEEPVSMRCRRHKRRFNVPKSWLDKCGWLCPRCYEKLSEEERGKYRPMKMSEPREAEDGKPIVRPSTAIKGSVEGDTGIPEGSAPKTHKEEIIPQNGISTPLIGAATPRENPNKAINKRKHKPHEHYKPSILSSNPAIAALLPRYRIECQRCGEVVPCHYPWFDNSTVLCPLCYGKMTDYEIRMFHQSHHAERPTYIPNSLTGQKASPAKPIDFPPCKVPSITEIKWTKESNMVNSGGIWPKSRIMSSSRGELIEACRLGKVSKARCRIELRRRANASFYNMFPPEVEAAPIPVL